MTVRVGKVRISERLLDTLISQAMNSELHVIGRPEHFYVNDSWEFLVEGQDCPIKPDGTKAAYVDLLDLQQKREWREAQDDS